jgi:uncharacterized DUF497 family protein
MGCGLIFEWDERKRRGNLRKHGFDFADCAAVFTRRTATIMDDYDEYGETRFVTVGMLHGRMVAVAHTEREGAVRVISMRKAAIHEEAFFFETVPD